jgi:hypothetical protein
MILIHLLMRSCESASEPFGHCNQVMTAGAMFARLLRAIVGNRTWVFQSTLLRRLRCFRSAAVIEVGVVQAFSGLPARADLKVRHYDR